MKTTNTHPHPNRRHCRCAALAFGLALIAAPPLTAQTYEEDEWYDPTDWFDGNNLEYDDTYDYEAYDYDYDYGYNDVYDYGNDWNDWDAYDTWGVDDWDTDYYDADYWDDYDWYDTYDTIDADPVDTYTYVIFANPVDGQSQNNAGQRNASSQQNRSGQRDRSMDQAQSEVSRLRGTVEGVRNLNLERSSGAAGTYTVAKVSLENGKSTVVNLGRESQLRDVDLQKGDKIEAIGRRGQVGGETVFVAQKLKAGDQTIEANPAIRLAKNDASMKGQSHRQSGQQTAGSRQQSRQDSQLETFQGTVASIDETTITAGTKDHTYVNLQLESGESALVDFGPSADLDKIDLQEGDTVTVKGYTEPSGGREVLMPSLLKVDGERMESITS